MGIEENKAAIRQEVDEAWNKGEYSEVISMISPEYIYHSPTGRDLKGHDGFRQIFSIWRTACPDLHAEIREIVGEGDTVVVQLSWTGTFTGKFLDSEPTGNKIHMQEVWIHHFRDGKDAEATPFANLQSLANQTGIDSP